VSRSLVALGLASLLLLHGCASYTPKDVTVPKPAVMPAWVREGVVAVGADPYLQKERQKAAFDGDMSEEGILPVQVLVLNEGPRRLLVRASDMILLLPDGRQIASAGATAVATRFEQGIGDVIGWGIGFGIIGMLAASANKDSVRTARLSDYRSKELAEAFLDPGQSAHGFVFFIPPIGTTGMADGVLLVHFVDANDASRQSVRVPLRGTGDLTARVVPEAARTPQPVQPLRPEWAGFVGVWRGQVAFRMSVGTVRTVPVTLRIYPEGETLRWTVTRPLVDTGLQATASGAVETAGQAATLTGRYDGKSGPLAGTEISYGLRLDGTALTGAGSGADRIVHSLSLQRVSSE
jgi:hypothetical protein